MLSTVNQTFLRKAVPKSILVFLLVVLATVLTAGPAVAHTGFESSDPANGDDLVDLVDEIVVTFSGPAEPTGEGFVVLDAAGLVRTPDSVSTNDDLSFVLAFDEPLGGGDIGVRWNVKAPDAHPISGSFAFTVNTEAQSVVPDVSQSPDDEPLNPDDSVAESERTSEALDLGSFLDTSSNSAPYASLVGAIGRAIGFIGTVLALGGLVFATIVLRGAEGDIRSVLKWVRRSGILILVGAIIELAGQLGLGSVSWSVLQTSDAYGPTLRSNFGTAVILRGFGGIVLGFGALPKITKAVLDADPILAIEKKLKIGAGSHLAIAAEDKTTVNKLFGEPYLHSGDHAWKRTLPSSLYSLVFASPLLLSHIFAGHTVSKGTRWISASVDIVHVIAGATWAGGLLMMALVLWRRHRRGEDLRALQLAVRFSVVAAAALVVAGIAGLVLTITILDSPSELWSTPWGRLLIAKTAVVAVGAVAGGYNHKVLIPQMLASETGNTLDSKFKRSVTIEAIVLTVVVVITAFLVGASSV